jgi:hypothetical protein
MDDNMEGEYKDEQFYEVRASNDCEESPISALGFPNRSSIFGSITGAPGRSEN